MSATTRDATLRARLEARKRRMGPPTEKSDTWLIAQRLFGYMAGGQSRPKFIMAMVLRVVALVALAAMPYFTGQAINVVTTGGTASQLSGWIVPALIAGAAYFLMSFVAERVFSQLATTGLYNLQRHLFEHMQTLSLTFLTANRWAS
jgi:ABC-type multidrug transport system fused ATPase/permease subunit